MNQSAIISHPPPGTLPPGEHARAAVPGWLVPALLLVLGLLASSPGGGAEVAPDPAAPASTPAVTDNPAGVTGRDLVQAIEPAVRIVERENHAIEEFRAGNNVYMLKVKPQNGPPYYLVDPDGSGNYEWRRRSLGNDVRVPHWAILKW